MPASPIRLSFPMSAIWPRALSIAAPTTSASRVATATSSMRCSKPNTAAISTTPARDGCKASLCLPTRSIARLDRTGQGPSGAASDRPQIGSAHDRLQRGKIRLNRPEYARLDFLDSAEGQAICLGLAREFGDWQARIADERLALKPTTDGAYQTTATMPSQFVVSRLPRQVRLQTIFPAHHQQRHEA